MFEKVLKQLIIKRSQSKNTLTSFVWIEIWRAIILSDYKFFCSHMLWSRNYKACKFTRKIIQKQPPKVFYKKGVLENLTKFVVKHPCRSLFFNKIACLRPAALLKRWLRHRCFPINYPNSKLPQNLKGPLLGPRQLLTTQSPLKMIKNTFYFMFKAHFILEIFAFWSWLLGYVEKLLGKKTLVNSEIYDLTDWTTNNYNRHITNILRSKGNQEMKFD